MYRNYIQLKNPIQPIIAYAEFARKGQVDKDEALDIIHREALRLRELANDILDASKIEGRSLQCRMEEIDLNELLRKVVESARIGLNDRSNLAIDLKTDPRITSIVADQARMTQVVNNLLDNALKFTTKGVVTVTGTFGSTEPESLKARAGSEIEIEVSDSGPGIPPELLPKLFTKFSTRDAEGKNKNGTGLGLFITKAIVEAHGGQIHGENNPNGVGARFEIVLPPRGQAELESPIRATYPVSQIATSFKASA